MISDDKKVRSNNNEPDEETKIYLTPDSTLQTSEEHQHDQTVDVTKDTAIEVSNVDLRETEIDRIRREMPGGESSDNS